MKLVDVPEKHLPTDFADRLVRAVRRRKRVRRLRVVALLVCAGILGVGLVGGFCCKDEDLSSTEARLIATHPQSTNDTKVTSLLMLGFFKECLKRNKNGRKKEED